jgi:uncharacterized protein (UPF0261 family)
MVQTDEAQAHTSMASKTIAILATLDTKAAEAALVRDQIVRRGHEALVIDVGTTGKAPLKPDISLYELARGDGALVSTFEGADRGAAVEAMSRLAADKLRELHRDGRFDGVIGLGGSGGTSICCAAMRVLPLGVPKLMVSTVAGGDVSGYVGEKDIVMTPAIVDLAGLNRISRGVLTRAAAAICGMAETDAPRSEEDKPLIVASMFGNTTRCVQRAKEEMECAGYEVIVFHATGSGGRTLESLVEAGMIAGVLDITTTELADELCGGVMSAGPERLMSAARRGVPAVVVPGCLDMVNFWGPDTVPQQYRERRLYPHNPNVTLMRTNVEENRELGRRLAERVNQSRGPVTVLLPLGGLSMIDSAGGTFWWPEADRALFDAIRENLRRDIPVIETNQNINEPAFADRCAAELTKQLTAKLGGSR